MQMFPDPDLADVLRRDRHHQLTAHRWLNEAAPRSRSARTPGVRDRIGRRVRRGIGR